MAEQLKLNIIFLLYPLAALIPMLFQMDIGIAKKFGGATGKALSTLVLVASCVSLHLLQGPFKHFSNVLTAAIAFYFLANFMPNWGLGVPAFRNAANSADLAPTDVAEIASRFLFAVLALFTVLYLFFALAGSDIAFLPSANNAYRRILKMEQMMM